MRSESWSSRWRGSASTERLVLVVLGDVAVAPGRTGAGDRPQRSGQAVDVGGRRAEAHAGAHRARQRRVQPRPQLSAEPRDLAVRETEQLGDQRMRAEAPVANPDRV